VANGIDKAKVVIGCELCRNEFFLKFEDDGSSTPRLQHSGISLNASILGVKRIGVNYACIPCQEKLREAFSAAVESLKPKAEDAGSTHDTQS